MLGVLLTVGLAHDTVSAQQKKLFGELEYEAYLLKSDATYTSLSNKGIAIAAQNLRGNAFGALEMEISPAVLLLIPSIPVFRKCPNGPKIRPSR